ncbi:MAG TPA: hypothetical protein VHU15_06000 [Stellaceae bacterium]|jgi:hypothetical protein|nr:hypothetical protein [Stellaceae bacterium]
MKTAAMAGVAASLLTLAGFAGTAQAQCVWTAGLWTCAPRATVIVPPAYTIIYPPPNPAFGRYGWNWFGPDQPNANPGAGTGD